MLIHTGRDAYIDEPDYMADRESPPRRHGGSTSTASASWASTPGAGTDRSGYRLGSTGGGRLGVFWASHQADLAYCQIERLANLAQLPATGFTVACFPLRLVGASAAPARVVAVID